MQNHQFVHYQDPLKLVAPGGSRFDPVQYHRPHWILQPLLLSVPISQLVQLEATPDLSLRESDLGIGSHGHSGRSYRTAATAAVVGHRCYAGSVSEVLALAIQKNGLSALELEPIELPPLVGRLVAMTLPVLGMPVVVQRV